MPCLSDFELYSRWVPLRTPVHTKPKCGAGVAQNLSDMWLSTFEISASPLRSVTEIPPKSQTLRVNRSPIRYGFRAGANSARYGLSNNVFERRTWTGTGLFWFFDGGFAQIFSQIASITVKKLRNTNFISSRHVKRENTSLPVDVRRSKTPLLKLPIVWTQPHLCLQR